jgi:hypothetical protein
MIELFPFGDEDDQPFWCIGIKSHIWCPTPRWTFWLRWFKGPIWWIVKFRRLIVCWRVARWRENQTMARTMRMTNMTDILW